MPENRNRPETKWPGSIHSKIFVNCRLLLFQDSVCTMRRRFSLLQMRFEQKETKVTKCVPGD